MTAHERSRIRNSAASCFDGQPSPPSARARLARMLGLTGGEWFLVIFITASVVSAPLWPLAGQRVGSLFSQREPNTRNGKETTDPN